MILALTIAVLVTGGVYLLLQRSMVHTIFGLGLLSHATNFLLLAAGVPGWRAEPLGHTDPAVAADPLPQAFVLTAIVISMAVTIVMLALAVIGHNDDQQRIPRTGQEVA